MSIDNIIIKDSIKTESFNMLLYKVYTAYKKVTIYFLALYIAKTSLYLVLIMGYCWAGTVLKYNSI